MQIQLNTDNSLTGSEQLVGQLEGDLRTALDRLSECITRVEVNLSDLNGGEKGGSDKRCLMDARITGRQPLSVTHVAATVDLAIEGAADKLTSALDATFGKLDADRRMGARQANNETT